MRPRRGRVALAGVAAALMVVVAGCSSGSDEQTASDTSDSADAATGSVDAGQPQGVAEEASSGRVDETMLSTPGSGGQDPVLDLDQVAFASRDVIRTGSLSLVVRNLAATRVRVAALVDRFGGVIASETTMAGPPVPGLEDTEQTQGVEQTMLLGLQVPTDSFDAAVAGLSDLGVVRARSIQTQDVTGQVADVDSRVESARAALERVRALLTRAQSLGTVIRLESVLSNRQADLEALIARQRALAGQTSLATIELELRTPPERREPPPPEDEEELRGFVAGVGEGWDGLREVMVGVGTVVGVVLPFALVGAVVAAPVLVWRRRRGQPVSPPAT